MKKLLLTILVFFICFLNMNGQTFTKVTSGSIVNDGSWSYGASWVDYDNDGDFDMLVTNRGSDHFLYQNNGDGTFTKITSATILTNSNATRGLSWGDYDNDGNVDVFIANGADEASQNNDLYKNNGDGTFTKVSSGNIVADGGGSYTGEWVDYDNDGHLDMFVANDGGNNFLYHNNGDGTFAKITSGSIVNDGKDARGAVWADYDNDGDRDLFVSNFGGIANDLYRNDGGGNFTQITSGPVVNDIGMSDGASWADYDNDGDLDLFVTNFDQVDFFYTNNGDGTFTKVTTGTIVSNVGRTVSSNWGDFDNDGDLDLFTTNWGGENNFLYINNGNGTFIRDTSEIVAKDGGLSHVCVWGDYDKDGDLDLFVTNGNSENEFLYNNNGNSNSWIDIKCTGTVSNKSAIGAKVRLKAMINGNPVWQLREVTAQSGWGGSNSLNVHFGLGNANVIDSIKVEWPSGNVCYFTGVATNQFMNIDESCINTGLASVSFIKNFNFNIYPNPFENSASLEYNLENKSNVLVEIYNYLGQKIFALANENQIAGKYNYPIGKKEIGCDGIFLVKLTIDNKVYSKNLVVTN